MMRNLEDLKTEVVERWAREFGVGTIFVLEAKPLGDDGVYLFWVEGSEPAGKFGLHVSVDAEAENPEDAMLVNYDRPLCRAEYDSGEYLSEEEAARRLEEDR